MPAAWVVGDGVEQYPDLHNLHKPLIKGDGLE